jgi:hypothetical protein
LERRISNIPELISQTLAEPVPCAPPRLATGSIVTSGAGIAAGPARFLATYLRHEHGLAARYCPPSAFAFAGRRPAGDTLVVFSQGLSANAQMVLQHAPHFGHVTLITASHADPSGTLPQRCVDDLVKAGVQVVTHGPNREDGMLVRVLGPTASALQSVRWAAGFGKEEALRRTLVGLSIAVNASQDRANEIAGTLNPEVLLGDVGFVTIGGYGDACRGLSWKWMEGLWATEPPLWDILQVAHGPLQTFWNREITLIALTDDSESAAALLVRLQRVIHPERHRLVCLKATTPGALAIFEHGAALDRLMIAALKAQPRDLGSWPAKGADEPLYGLAAPLE